MSETPEGRPFPSADRVSGAWPVSWLLAGVLVVTGCQTSLTRESASPGEGAPSALTADLLYDILVAHVATQRNRPGIALESLSRAAYQTRDPRLIAQALRHAEDNQAFQQASELAQLLYRLEPGNTRAALSLANAQFRLGQRAHAFDLLLDLAVAHAGGNAAVLQDVASLLAAEEPAGAYEHILAEFTAKVVRRPDHAGLWLCAGLLASRLNLDSEYTALLDKSLELKRGWETPAVLKLTALAGRGGARADQYAAAHLDEFPGHHAFRLKYADVLLERSDLEGALAQLRVILRSNPRSQEALFTSAMIYLDLGRPGDARDALDRYLQLNPGNDRAKLFLADLEFQDGNYTRAGMLLYRVGSRRYYLEAQIRLADVIVERDGLEPALAHLRQVDADNDEQQVRLILEQDRLLQEHARLDRSMTILYRAMQRFPDHPDLLYNRGLLAARMDLLELHETDMRRLIELEPENAHAYNALGYTLADHNRRLDEALELITTANRLLPDNPFILDSLGWIHFRLGENRLALKYLHQAIAGLQDAEIAAHLGEVLWITGKREQAMEIWRRGARWNPGNAVLMDTVRRFSVELHSTVPARERRVRVAAPADAL